MNQPLRTPKNHHSLHLSTSACPVGGADGPRFDVRNFMVTEAISTLWRIQVDALHPSADIDFHAVVGRPATFAVRAPEVGMASSRDWSGIVSELDLVRALDQGQGLSEYRITVVPRLWLLTQRRNYRIFQYLSEVDIATTLLREWNVPFDLRLDERDYPKRKYKVQYAETDYAFLYRVLADVGVTYFFEPSEDGLRLVLADAPQRLAPLEGALFHHDAPPATWDRLVATDVRKSQRVRPNRITMRDRDYRRASNFELQASATVDDNNDLELFYYPENFNFVTDGDDGDSPAADDRGRARTSPDEGKKLATIDLEARRNDTATLELTSNDLRIRPGTTFAMEGHPADDLNAPNAFLCVESRLAGRFDAPLVLHVEAVTTAVAYRASTVGAPRIIGVESATVVGPDGEEIHCDEFGRVRVHFHWDRRSGRDGQTSCWVPVSQTWGGAGYGGIQIPRVGQEVLVEFLNGDPDRPIITGRVYTAVNKVPMKLPAEKTQTVLRSCSTGGTGGYNEIRMEDNAGHEFMHIHCQQDKDEMVNRDCNKHVGKTQTLRVQVNQSVSVGGARTVFVKGPQNRRVNGNLCDIVGGTTTLRSGGDISVESTKGGYTLQALKKVVVDSAEQIVLRCGASIIVMNQNDITIQSPLVAVNPGSAFAADAAKNGVLMTEPAPPEPPGPEPEVDYGDDPNWEHQPDDKKDQDRAAKEQLRKDKDPNNGKRRREELAAREAWKKRKAQYDRDMENYRKKQQRFEQLRKASTS